MKLKLLTEAIFIVPLVIAIWAGFYIYAGIIVLSITSGLLYHLHEEKKFLEFDVVVSLTLISTNLYYVYLSGFKYPYFHFALLALVVSFYFWFKGHKKNYDFNHSMWHVASFFITLFCILAYIIN